MKPMRRHFVVLFIILKSDETLMADNSRINYVSIKGCIITATVSARTKTIISWKVKIKRQSNFLCVLEIITSEHVCIQTKTCKSGKWNKLMFWIVGLG